MCHKFAFFSNSNAEIITKSMHPDDLSVFGAFLTGSDGNLFEN